MSDIIKTPFYFGGLASCSAAIIVHPLDLTKVRLQNAKGNQSIGMFGTVVKVIRTEGFFKLYAGLSASILRQATYSTARLGGYEKLKQIVLQNNKNPSTFQLLGCSTAAGIAGGLCGNPGDVINVRMQNDGQLPTHLKRNYMHAFDGLVRMTKEEGLASLFRGVGPNINRAILMTSSQCVSYDRFKAFFLGHHYLSEGIGLHLLSSMLAGLVATTACSPVDVIKTRMMSASGSESTLSAMHVMRTMYRSEGVLAFFKGWTPSFMRTGPQTIFTFIFLEQFKKWHSMWHHHPLVSSTVKL
ncbi:mitochondrial carrier domain-containing protein [Gilbertella persicaria]|uniref:mitochondrial carrier domain-containing protein n=1 Tax=Gilbertella persicaria TaxID=101096 RepID=UPI00221EF251|nr:mitochondrial carrier domain-containing protein [Gilbertella persicaria]KAI8074292.1 mitochondrial carrier domain-containing protein [Gilbertella persicaria]